MTSALRQQVHEALRELLFAAGLLLYLRATRAADAIGKWALWALAAFLVAIQASDAVGPPPPSVGALTWVAQAQWLLVLWGYWIDRHRLPVRHSLSDA